MTEPTKRLVTPGRALELIETLDGYSKLDDVQRDLITRWADGEDVNDVRKFDDPNLPFEPANVSGTWGEALGVDEGPAFFMTPEDPS